MRRLLKPLALVCALTAGACSSSSTDSNNTSSQTQTIEIYSWWTAGGEAQALSHLIDLHKTSYPTDDVLNSTASATDSDAVSAAFTAMNKRLAKDDPPDAWQAILGKNLLSYTQFVPAEPGSAIAASSRCTAESSACDFSA